MKTEIAFCKMSFDFCLGYLQTCSPTDSFTISQNDPDEKQPKKTDFRKAPGPKIMPFRVCLFRRVHCFLFINSIIIPGANAINAIVSATCLVPGHVTS